MDLYPVALLTLVLACVAQTLAAWLAVRLHRRSRLRLESMGWLAVALASGLLTLRYLRALELAFSTGIYDAPQALLALPTSFLFLLGFYALRPKA